MSFRMQPVTMRLSYTEWCHIGVNPSPSSFPILDSCNAILLHLYNYEPKLAAPTLSSAIKPSGQNA